MTLPLLIVGAGGFARETIEAVRAAGDRFDLLGILDDDPAKRGKSVLGAAVLGGTSLVQERPGASVVVATGRPDDYGSRARIVSRLGLPDARYATVIHPAASLGASVRVGRGSVVLAGAVATSEVMIGMHVAVMPGVILTHDDVVEDFVTIASGVRLGGAVVLGRGCYLGAGALVREQRRIGERALVGMGSVVTKDVPPAEVWMGVPARRVRHVDRPPAMTPTKRA